jgi:opacity protein-like surface antigen
MKRALLWSAVLWLFVSVGFTQQSSIKLSGGIGYATGGDLNATIQGVSDLRRDLDGATGELKPLNLGMNFDVEFIHHFTPNIGLGMGIGYFQASKESGPSSSEIGVPGYYKMSSAYSITPNFSAIPITLNLHYYQPVGPKLRFDLHGGLGYYLTRLSFSSHDVLSDQFFDMLSENWTEDIVFKSTKGGFGFQGGIGIEFDVTPKIAIVLDGSGRFASVSGFKGEFTFKQSGDYAGEESAIDYYFWTFDETFYSSTYTQYDFYNEKPEGEDITKAKEGSVSLSGFVVTLGIRIKF